MKKYYILIACTCWLQSSFAQNIIYDYDTAGNRILRKVSEALPVKLVRFNVSKDPEGISALLTWETVSEINADRFEIERSRDGKTWTTLGEVKARGEGNPEDKKTGATYFFTDQDPLGERFVSTENLYRLKMIDRGEDGKFTHSRIQSLYFAVPISFYPNPVRDLLQIQAAFDGKVQLLNQAGKMVYHSDHIPEEGIDMRNLSAGVYLVRITYPDGSFAVSKIVKR